MSLISFYNLSSDNLESIETGKIYYTKVRDVKSPERGYETSAGIDFFVPKFDSKFISDLKEKNPNIFDESKFNYVPANGCISYGSTSGTLTINNNASGSQVTYDLNDENNSKVKFDDEKGLNYILLDPHKGINVPSGIKVRMDKPCKALIAFNKSGVATKHQLQTGACVVDFEYTGEVHINVINNSSKVVRIYEDMKLVQFVETAVYHSDIVEIANKKYDALQSERGAKGFGSTNKK